MLLTNTFSPPLLEDKLLPREELGKKFSAFQSHKVTVLSAPAGHGKSAFVAQQLKQLKLPSTWVSLNKQNNHSRQFWLCVASSLHAIDEKLSKKSLTLLNSAKESELSHAINSLIDELRHFQRNWACPNAMLLVLDNFHFISDTSLLEQFNLFLDHLPRYLHCIIISRTQPPIQFSQRLLKNELLHFSQAELKLSLDETSELISRFAGDILPAAEMKQLHKKTEGWLAALQFIGMALKKGNLTIDSLLQKPGSDQLLSDYLAGEVLKQLPPELLGLMFNLSCLPRFNKSLVTNIVSQTKATEVISQLEKAALLQTILNHSSGWFRIHGLICDWLKDNRAIPQNNIDFIRHAANWFYEHDYYLEAFEIAIHYKVWDIALSVVDKASPALFHQGKYQMAGGLITEIPDSIIIQHPKIALIKILVERNNGLSDAIPSLIKVQALLLTLETEDEEIRIKHGINTLQELRDIKTLATLIEADIARYTGKLNYANTLTMEIEKYTPTNHSVFGGWILTGLGADELLKGNIATAYSFLIRALEISKENNDGVCFLVSICWLGPLLILRGQLDTAIDFLQEWQQWITKHGFDGIALSSVIERVRALVYREKNLIIEANECIAQMEWAYNDLDPINKVYSQWAKISIALAASTPSQCLIEVDKLEVTFLKYFPQWNFAIPELDCVRGLIHLKQNNPGPLLQWAAKFTSTDLLATNYSNNYLKFVTEENIAIRIKIELGEDMASTISEIRSSAQEKGIIQREVYSYLLDTINAKRQGKENTALKYLQRALEMASIYGFVQMFVEEADSLIELIAKLPLSATTSEIHQQLNDAINPTTASQQQHIATSPQTNPLSTREYEVLKLIVDGQTNQQISELLTISITTVKSHLRNIYNKLDVKRRTQAIAEARTRNWI